MSSLIKNIFGGRQKDSSGSNSPKKTSETASNTHVLDRSRIVFIFFLSLTWLASVFAIIFPGTEEKQHFVDGQISPVTCYSDFDFSYTDENETEKRRNLALRNSPDCYRMDKTPIENSMKLSQEFLTELDERMKQGAQYLNAGNVSGGIKGVVFHLPEDIFNVISMLNQSEERRRAFMHEIEMILSKGVISDESRAIMNPLQRIRMTDSANHVRAETFRAGDIMTVSDASSDAAYAVSKLFSVENRDAVLKEFEKIMPLIIQPNIFYDADLTQEFKEKASEQVEPVRQIYKKGDMILRKGEVITPSLMCLYKTYISERDSILSSEKFWKKALNGSIICLLLMILNGIYIHHIHPEVFRSNKLTALMSIVVIITILADTFAIRTFNYLSGFFSLSPSLITSILPFALCSLVLSVMIGLRVGIYCGLFVSLIAALQLGYSFQTVLTGMILSAVAGFSVRHSPNHRNFFLSGAIAVSCALPFMDILSLWFQEGKPELVLTSIAFGVSNGIIVSALSLVLIFILESVFQVSTDMSLLLLSDYNHPLLKRLQLEAPGTYHHSLVVSTLAEQAAKEIGANPIRARVCALFHDIGKLSMPEYFTENDLAGENKHGDLNPKMSTLVILNHVKEGLKLAKKFKLRKIIREAIEQHHGNDLVYYFYRRAVDQNIEDKEVLDSDYRYPGPLPREKEVVLVSLADICEASSRALQKPSPAKIEALVSEIIRKRIRDGQLDGAEITLKEIAKIRQSFTKTLTQMMHGRIQYPKAEDDEDEDDLFSQNTVDPDKK